MIKIFDRRNKKIEKIRNEYLKFYYIEKDSELDESSLLSLGLNMYSKNSSIQKDLYHAFAISTFNQNITLHPQQLECLNILSNGDNLLLSAPTSFGKTFVALEYISKNNFNNIVFVVPTLALMNELFMKINSFFGETYNIVLNSSEYIEEKNIFIFVPERADNNFIYKLDKVDLLVFDEVYKLNRKKNDKRLIALNKSYFSLVDKASQTILLGPFIRDIVFERSKLSENITKYFTDYSPVYTKLEFVTKQKKDAFTKNELHNSQSKLVYFQTPNEIYKFSNYLIDNSFDKETITNHLTEWCDKYISPEWLPTVLLKKGIGIHHGKLPTFMRKYLENLFNEKQIVNMLCTSTLLEGINTPTKELIVYNSEKLSSFELNNLIGRVGRLNTFEEGIVYLFDEALNEKIIGDSKYEQITIIAEDNATEELAEVIYLDKDFDTLSPEEKDTFFKLENLLLKFDKTIDDLKQTDNFNFTEFIKFLEYIDIIIDLCNKYSFLKGSNPAHQKEATKVKGEIFDIFTKIIPNKHQYILNNLKKIIKVPIKHSTCVSKLLNLRPKNIYEKIKDEVNNVKEYMTKAELSIFIDFLFDLAFSYIKYDLYKIVYYIKFIFDDNYLENHPNNAIAIHILNTEIVNRFEIFNSSDDELLRILLDLNFPYSDASEIKKIINSILDPERLSTKKIIEAIQIKYDTIINSKEIENVSKDLIKVLLNK